MSKQRIVVTIFNEQYALKSDLPEEKVQKLANQVDSRMQRIHNAQSSLSLSRIAVLVALELADEAMNHKEAYDSLMDVIKEELKEG